MGRSQERKTSCEPIILKLPHPYLTAYAITIVSSSGGPIRYQLKIIQAEDRSAGIPPPETLHADTVSFSEVVFPSENEVPPIEDNSSWARARRAPYTTVSWSTDKPSAAQIWLLSYALVTQHPFAENFRVVLSGSESQKLGKELQSTGLFHRHPSSSDAKLPVDGYLLLRSCFWQGAGSPFGTRPVWAPNLDSANRPISTEYPLFPFQISPTTQFPALPRHIMHPVRAAKPARGSIIYSRWIPHLKEHFSMIAVDYKNQEHLELFHTWQNDPRVAAGWNETGTLEQHREYLRRLDEDQHVLTIFAKFNEVLFAYFEVYWAMEDNLGAHYLAHPYDRGRHSLVGDVRFRGPYRVSAWWSGLMHYMFLDEPRTMDVVGQPKATDSTVLAYDFAHGFHVDKLLDLPHKRSALMKCSREKFFQLSPMVWDGEGVVRPSLDALAKL